MSTSTRLRVLVGVAGLVVLSAPAALGLGSGASSAAPATTHRDPVIRYISVNVNKTTVVKGKKVTLKGMIGPSTAPAECIAGVVLSVEQSTKGAIYNTIGAVTTDSTGAYTVRETVKKKSKFRIAAPATANCSELQSPPRTVQVKKKHT